MLRIFRPNSPMSFGSWLLTGFGLASAPARWARSSPPACPGGLAAVARRMAEAAQLPAAAAGVGMSVYTAALLSATSTPLWAAAPGLLGARFGAAAVAAGSAALSLGARRRGEAAMADRLDRVAALATGVGLVASGLAAGRTEQAGVRRPAGDAARGLGTIALAEALPLAGYAVAALAPGARREASLFASLAVVLGNVVLRTEIIRAGNASADRPGDNFRLAQPGRPTGRDR